MRLSHLPFCVTTSPEAETVALPTWSAAWSVATCACNSATADLSELSAKLVTEVSVIVPPVCACATAPPTESTDAAVTNIAARLTPRVSSSST